MSLAAVKSDKATGKRARSKAANRKAILAAARNVFARIGYDATTVRDIIRETELAAGTFYNYFRSKEEVFEAISGESLRQFRPRLREVRERATDFEAYIREAFRAYFQFLADENEDAINADAPHAGMIGVRVDTPEMGAIFDEIRADFELVLSQNRLANADMEYLAAAAIGIAREMGDHMLQRRPVDVDGATEFAVALVLAGARGVADTAG